MPSKTRSDKARPITTELDPEGRLLHSMQFAIRWSDMDALGHVNNAKYFQYFEMARLQWYEGAGFGAFGSPERAGDSSPDPAQNPDQNQAQNLNQNQAQNQGMVIVDNHAQYLKPVVYPSMITVRMAGHSPGRSSFISTYTLSVGDELYTQGSAKIVWVNADLGKSVPLPESVRQLVS